MSPRSMLRRRSSSCEDYPGFRVRLLPWRVRERLVAWFKIMWTKLLIVWYVSSYMSLD